MTPITEMDKKIEKESWDSDRRYMTSTLCRLLHHNLCWADKMDIVKSIHEIEMDYEDYVKESAHLSVDVNEPECSVTAGKIA